MVDRVALEMRSTRKRTGGSNPSLSASLRSASYGWLTPVRRTKFAERRLSSEALAKGDWCSHGFGYLNKLKFCPKAHSVLKLLSAS